MYTFEKRLERVRQALEQENLPAILINHPPNIFYLSGFSGTSGWVLLTKKQSVLFTDFRYVEQATLESPSFEIVKVAEPQGFSLFELIAKFLRGENISRLAVEENHLSLRNFTKLKKTLGGVELLPCNELVEQIRAIKEEMEIERITAATSIADGALQDVIPLLKAGISECDLAAELEYRMRRRGAAGIAFPTIVASGTRSALPHGIATKRIINEGEIVVVDFGAVWNGYCSDMTRTFVFGEPTREQERIYNLVCTACDLALEAVKSGRRAAEVDGEVRQFFEAEGVAGAFGHGLGHGVGIEVHEHPSLSPHSFDILQEGMVFSVEPGIYLEGRGGVRVEDLIVLCPHGPQVLPGSRRKLGLFK